MRKLPYDLLAPVLLAIYPLLFFYNRNFLQVDLSDVVLMMAVSLTGALIFYGGLLMILRNRQRASFVTSLMVLLFFMFGHVRNLAANLGAYDDSPVARHSQSDNSLLIVWGLILGAGLLLALAIRNAGLLRRINQYVGIFTGLLIIVALGGIIVSAATASSVWSVPEVQFEAHAPDVLPDIYYIILDEYAGRSSLIDNLGYDNRAFLDSLRDRGFFVADDAHANYFRTYFSLASSLNMTYLDSLNGYRTDDWSPTVALVQDNPTIRTLKSFGYTFISFATSMPVTHDSPQADQFYDGDVEEGVHIGPFALPPELIRLTDFHQEFVQTTLLSAFLSLDNSRARNLFNLKTLAEIPTMPQPTFTFAHMMLPHDPFVFDQSDGPVNPNGRDVDGQVVDQAKYEAHADYIDQVVFTNRVISQLVDTLLDESDTEPIIIIQGDHGFRWMCADCRAESPGWDDTYYADVMLPILNAYYLPGGGDSLLYPAISPVNSFRVIFDYYFRANLDLLDERYFRPEEYYTRPYFFQDISPVVQDSITAAHHP